MAMNNVKSSSGGFTLLETAIIISISSILLTMTMSLVKVELSQLTITKNQQRLTTIQQAINNFKTLNNRLPCPASYAAVAGGTPAFGREDTTSVPCIGTYNKPGRDGPIDAAGVSTPVAQTIIFGALPVRDLGLPDSYIADNYGYMYTYGVTQSETTAPMNGFAGGINVVDNSNAAMNSVLPLDPKGNVGTATYAVVDHGKDGKGAYYFNGITKGGLLANTCSSAAGYDQLNCSFEAGAPAPLAPFAFSAAPYSNLVGTSHYDDLIVYGTSFGGSTKICQTVYNAPITAVGTSVGHYQKGLAYGWADAYSLNTVNYYGNFGVALFYGDAPIPANTDIFGIHGSPYEAGFNTVSPVAQALCPAGAHIVTGGCSQTNGIPNLPSGTSNFTNIYTADYWTASEPWSSHSGLLGDDTTPGPLPCGGFLQNPCNFVNAQQLIMPPLSHPVYTSPATQGWECDGSSASGIYTQAYAICCSGG